MELLSLLDAFFGVTLDVICLLKQMFCGWIVSLMFYKRIEKSCIVDLTVHANGCKVEYLFLRRRITKLISSPSWHLCPRKKIVSATDFYWGLLFFACSFKKGILFIGAVLLLQSQSDQQPNQVNSTCAAKMRLIRAIKPELMLTTSPQIYTDHVDMDIQTFLHHPSFPWFVTTMVLAGLCFIFWCIYMYLYKDVDRTQIIRAQYTKQRRETIVIRRPKKVPLNPQESPGMLTDCSVTPSTSNAVLQEYEQSVESHDNLSQLGGSYSPTLSMGYSPDNHLVMFHPGVCPQSTQV